MNRDAFTGQVKLLDILRLVFRKNYIQHFVSFCLKHAKISAVRKIILFRSINKILFFTLTDIFTYFKQKTKKNLVK